MAETEATQPTNDNEVGAVKILSNRTNISH